MRNGFRGALAIVLMGLSGCVTISTPKNAIAPNYSQADTTSPPRETLAQGQVLSAFFGLDNRLPMLASWRVCKGAGGADGMPLVFDHELDVSTVEPGDFRVVTKAGAVGKIACVTMMPAADPGELRTVLLVGELGSAQSDPPVRVEVAGHVLSKDHRYDYAGAKIEVMPLEAGPVMVWAEVVPLDQVKPRSGSWAEGSGCPADTQQAVRVTWTGGVRLKDGDELGVSEARMYRVDFADGSKAAPFALADLDDGDNNHVLCLSTNALPKRVSLPAGIVTDPNRDRNPATSVPVHTTN